MPKRICELWTKAEITALEKSIRVDKKCPYEVAIGARSKSAIYHKALLLGLVQRQNGYASRRPWPIEHKRKLIELKRAGMFTQQIATELPYNTNAIQQQLKRMKSYGELV